jgi:adenylate cyclase
MNSVKCARSIFSVIKNGNNPILDLYDCHELDVKTGIDEGGNVKVLFGQDKYSLVDIMGFFIGIIFG